MTDFILPSRSIITRVRLAVGTLLLASAPNVFLGSPAHADPPGGAAPVRFVYRQGRDRPRAYPMRTFRQRLQTTPVRHQIAHQIMAARSVMTQAEQAATDFGATRNTYLQNDAVADAAYRTSLAVQDLSDGLRQATPAERPALLRAQRSIVRRAERVHATLNAHLVAQGRSVSQASVARLQSLRSAIDGARNASAVTEGTLPSSHERSALRSARLEARSKLNARVNEIEAANPASAAPARARAFNGARSFRGALRSLRRISPGQLHRALTSYRGAAEVSQEEINGLWDVLSAEGQVDRARYVLENNPSMQATAQVAALSQAFQQKYDQFLTAALRPAGRSRGGAALSHLAEIAARVESARDWDRGGDRP